MKLNKLLFLSGLITFCSTSLHAGGFGDPGPVPIDRYFGVECESEEGDVSLRGTLAFRGNFLAASHTSFRAKIGTVRQFFSDASSEYRYDGGFGKPTTNLEIRNYAYPNSPIQKLAMKTNSPTGALVTLQDGEEILLRCRMVP